MTTLDASFTREEAARLLAVPDVLPERTSAHEIESWLRDSLLHLYQALAERRIAEPLYPELEVEMEMPAEVAPPFEDVHEPPQRPHAEHRRAPRYDTSGQLGGTYRDVDFTILEISATGLRIRHDDTLRAGDEARLTFTLPEPSPRTYTFRARVAWTSIAQRGNGPSYCVSGLQITANIDHLQKAVEHLRKKRGERTPPALVGLSDDDVAAIIRAYRRFTSDPVEASRWYSRARFSVVDETVRRAAPERARDREEVLGIWEYLERKVAIDAVTNVVGWLRQTRSAAAM